MQQCLLLDKLTTSCESNLYVGRQPSDVNPANILLVAVFQQYHNIMSGCSFTVRGAVWLG
jgi:hypothetical protein